MNTQRSWFLAGIIAVFASGVQAYDAVIRWNDVHQRITGFGASGAWTSKNIMAFSEPSRTTCLNQLFDTISGAGISMVRNMVPYDLQDASGNWNWTTDGPQVAFMQEAQKRGVKYFWGAPWTPPLWMKDNNNKIGGHLAADKYQNFATYLTRYATEYESRYGIPISGVSVQNEPHFSPNYDGCMYSGTQIRDFIKNNLGPTLRAASPKTTIIAPETNWDQRDWSDPTLNDPLAAQYLGVAAFHFYNDDKLATPYPLVKNLKKELWQSECSWAGDAGPSMRGAALWFKARHDLLTRAEVNAWHFWWFFDPKPDGEGLLSTNGNGGYITTKRLWTLGNYSKFVRPGWYMMGLPMYYSTDSLVSVSAFRDSMSGKFAIVAANFDMMSGPARTITINCDGFKPSVVTPWLTDETHDLVKQSDIAVVNGSFQITIPAMSVFTYAGSATPLASPDVKVDSFSVKTEMILAGQKDTLQWSTGNATSVSIDNGVGTVAVNGRAEVIPLATTTYTLTANGSGGPITRKIIVTVLTGRTPENPTGVNQGIDCSYYETNSNALVDFSGLTPIKTQSIATFSTSIKNRANDFSFAYKGYIDAPVDGVYQFSVKSCSNVAFLIGTTQVVYWDFYGGNFGGMGEPVIGNIALKAGKHAMSLGLHHAFGCNNQPVVLSWKVPGQVRCEVPAARLYHTGLPVVINSSSLQQRQSTQKSMASYALYNIRGQVVTRSAIGRINRTKCTSGVYLVKPDNVTGVKNCLSVIAE